jgi:hypothetical protein
VRCGAGRELMLQLADQLTYGVPQGPVASGEPLWRRLTAKASAGISALGQSGACRAPGGRRAGRGRRWWRNGASIGVVALLGGAAGPLLLPVAGAAVAGLVVLAAFDLRKAVEDDRLEGLEARVYELADDLDRGVHAPDRGDVLVRLGAIRLWAARAGATLANGWSLIEQHLGNAGVEALRALGEAVRRLRGYVEDIAANIATDIRWGAGKLRWAYDGVSDGVQRLRSQSL